MSDLLNGIKVLELGRILAAPWAGQVLADLGADVVKVEHPERGDDTRAWGPPFVEAEDGTRLGAAYFYCCNRGKRSLAADIATAEGQAAVRRLAARSDVLIENFKVGGLKKYRLDYDSLKADNPGLVYCSITGFGQNGPYAGRAGYDIMIQAMSGIMDLTGDPSGEPQKVGVAFADIFTALYAVIGIEAALLARRASGRGCHIDMALLDSQVGVLANQALNYFVTGRAPRRLGNAHPNIVPYQSFPTRDGLVILAVGNDRQFRDLCQVLGAPGLAAAPEHASNELRVANRGPLVSAIAALTGSWSRDDLLAALAARSVPAGPINSLEEVFADPQVIHRGLRVQLDHPRARGGSISGLRTPIMIDGQPLAAERPAPDLGQHTEEVLKEISTE